MKPGTVMKDLAIFKDKEAPVVLERSEYPEWVASLSEPLPSLANLRQIPDEEATDSEQRRFLKLTRRAAIKLKNQALKESTN